MSNLTTTRDLLLENVQMLFRDSAIEAHLHGSLARGNSDEYSDIDVWFTFPDDKIQGVLETRFEEYAKAGEIIHVCEPPQNAPMDGVQSSVIYRSEDGYLTVVDYSLCPLSTAQATPEYKKLFGDDIDFPPQPMGYNPQKKTIDESYRIDFCIGFILNSVKRIQRKQENPLSALLEQYKYLLERYSIPVPPITIDKHDLESLKKIATNISDFANEKQCTTIQLIMEFVDKVQKTTQP